MTITDTQQLIRSNTMIKVAGTASPATTTHGASTNIDKATMVRCYNSGGTARLITVQLADNTAIGTFTLAAGAVEYVDKNITDEIFAAHADIKISSVVVMG